MAGRRVSTCGGHDGGGRGGGRGSGVRGGRDGGCGSGTGDGGGRGSGARGGRGRRGRVVGGRAVGGGDGGGGNTSASNTDSDWHDDMEHDNEGSSEELSEFNPRNQTGRGYSAGRYGSQERPLAIRIADREIGSGPATRTLRAIMRQPWRAGIFTATDIDRHDPTFWEECSNDFFEYYTYEEDGSKEDALASVLYHMRENMRKIMYQERESAAKRAARYGDGWEAHKPKYFSDEVWNKFCEYWRSEQFQRRSAAGRAARGRVALPHTSGASSFARRRRDYKATHAGEDQDTCEHWVDVHTRRKKDKGTLISAKANEIIEEYVRISPD